jgi:hypothetical protein
MTIQQRLEYVQLLKLTVQICIKYPDDTDKVQQAVTVMENFIDTVVNDALNKVIGSKTAVYQDGISKSKKHN